MDTKISDLPSTSTPTTADLVPIVESGVTKRTTLGELFTALTSILQSGTGAIARTALAKLRDWVSVADYDTTAHFTAGMNALTSTIGMNELIVKEDRQGSGEVVRCQSLRVDSDTTNNGSTSEGYLTVAGTVVGAQMARFHNRSTAQGTALMYLKHDGGGGAIAYQRTVAGVPTTFGNTGLCGAITGSASDDMGIGAATGRSLKLFADGFTTPKVTIASSTITLTGLNIQMPDDDSDITWGTAGSRPAIRGNKTAQTLAFYTNAQLRVTIDQGIIVGAATGGNKGVGTANFAADIYKNNTAYTNPDYVFERFYTGQIVKFKDKEGAAEYKGKISLDEMRAFTKEHWHLPGFGQESKHGAFSGGDMLLARLEEAYLYIFDLHDRLGKLEERAAKANL